MDVDVDGGGGLLSDQVAHRAGVATAVRSANRSDAQRAGTAVAGDKLCLGLGENVDYNQLISC